jgi:hypothetical protein
MAFGTTAWAVLRGRGGVIGLVLFVLLSAVGASVGALAAEALGGSQADVVSGLGAAGGALLATLALGLAAGLGLAAVGSGEELEPGGPPAQADRAETILHRSELLPGALDTAPVAVSRFRSSTPGR